MKRTLHLILAAFLLIAAGMTAPAFASDSDDLDLAVEALSDSDSAEGNIMELEGDSMEDDSMEDDSMDDENDSTEDGEDDDSDGDLDDDGDDGTEGGDGI